MSLPSSRKSTMVGVGSPEVKRWYILLLFCMISAVQCNAYFTFSSVPSRVVEYYHLHDPGKHKVNSTIDLLLNYGPICFLLTAPLAAYILSLPITGLRNTIITAGQLIFIGSIIRSIPSILHDLPFVDYQITNSFWNCLIFLHFGQILINMAGPFIMGSPSKLSVIWFPESQRKTATSIATMAQPTGMCIGYLIGPYVTRTGGDGNHHNGSHLNRLLYLDILLMAIPWIMVMIHFPSSPATVPSIAGKAALYNVSVEELDEFISGLGVQKSSSISIWDASSSRKSIGSDRKMGTHSNQVNHQWTLTTGSTHSDIGHLVDNAPFLRPSHVQEVYSRKKQALNLWQELKCMIRSASTMIVVVIGGITIGSFDGWSAMLQTMMGTQSSFGLSTESVGIIGFTGNVACILGGIVIGLVTDKWYSKHLKLVVFRLFIGILIGFGVLMFVLPSPWSEQPMLVIADSKDAQYHWKMTIFLCALNGINGFLVGGCLPLFYELCVEVSYPVSEGSSATFLVFTENVTMLVMVGIGNWISTEYQTAMVVAVCLLCLILLSFVEERYRRL